MARTTAFFVDFVLLSVVTAFVWFGFSMIEALVGVGSMMTASLSEPGAVQTGSMVLGYALSLAQWAVIGTALLAYFVYLQANGGQTVGMKLLDVVVVSGDGGAIDLNAALKRTVVLLLPFPLMALASVFVPILGPSIALVLMFLWLVVEATVMFVSDDGRRLGDRLANTRVVETA